MDDHHEERPNELTERAWALGPEERLKELTEHAWALGYRLIKRNHDYLLGAVTITSCGAFTSAGLSW